MPLLSSSSAAVTGISKLTKTIQLNNSSKNRKRSESRECASTTVFVMSWCHDDEPPATCDRPTDGPSDRYLKACIIGEVVVDRTNSIGHLLDDVAEPLSCQRLKRHKWLTSELPQRAHNQCTDPALRHIKLAALHEPQRNHTLQGTPSWHGQRDRTKTVSGACAKASGWPCWQPVVLLHSTAIARI
jgi:hypothetical protein